MIIFRYFFGYLRGKYHLNVSISLGVVGPVVLMIECTQVVNSPRRKDLFPLPVGDRVCECACLGTRRLVPGIPGFS